MIVDVRTDDAFDEPTDLSRLLYHGSQRDIAESLQTHQHRHFDPTVGRFLSHDPLGYADSLGADTNLHRYASNSPLNPTDPTGM